MKGTKQKPSSRRLPWKVALIACLAACVAGVRDIRHDTARQGWWEERGPVVPHDSFPADCALCHIGEDWNTLQGDFAFDHRGATGVALEGAHSAAECLRCHNDRGPVSVFANRGCAGCHEDRHQGMLGSDCSACHGETDWRVKEVIAIHDRTRFPLIGAHAGAQCWRCHPGAKEGVFMRAMSECASCHQDDLARATVPDHIAQGLTMDCERCHIPTRWQGAAFDHPNFPLTGAHAATDCNQCHVGNVFVGTPTDCFSCHMTEYTTSTNPNHLMAGFPTSCESCHNTTTWLGATFNHTFPIESGAHKVLSCAECHTIPQNFIAFSCIDCHEHTRTKMDKEHEGESGYIYASSACLDCHPNGKS